MRKTPALVVCVVGFLLDGSASAEVRQTTLYFAQAAGGFGQFYIDQFACRKMARKRQVQGRFRHDAWDPMACTVFRAPVFLSCMERKGYRLDPSAANSQWRVTYEEKESCFNARPLGREEWISH